MVTFLARSLWQLYLQVIRKPGWKQGDQLTGHFVLIQVRDNNGLEWCGSSGGYEIGQILVIFWKLSWHYLWTAWMWKKRVKDDSKMLVWTKGRIEFTNWSRKIQPTPGFLAGDWEEVACREFTFWNMIWDMAYPACLTILRI